MKTPYKEHDPVIDARDMHRQVTESLGIPHARSHEQRRAAKRGKQRHERKPSSFNIWGWY